MCGPLLSRTQPRKTAEKKEEGNLFRSDGGVIGERGKRIIYALTEKAASSNVDHTLGRRGHNLRVL